jgi:spore coat polysaccharide biosynthesis protein SpsF
VNGDSPFLQPSLIDTGIQLFNTHTPDLVTNLLNRTYPYGVAVEVVKTSTLRNAINKNLSSYQQEHPTSFLYQNPDLFQIQEIPLLPADFSNLRLTVDTIDDKLAAESLLKKIRITLGNTPQFDDLNLILNLL